MPISLSALGVNPTRLYHGQPGSSATTLYTAPGTTGGTARTKVGTALLANPAPTAVAVRLGMVPQGGTADGTHYWLADQQIPGNTTLTIDLNQFLRPGDVLEGMSGSLPAPVGLTLVGSTTGGALAATTYYYKVTGTNSNGETVGSIESAVTTTGTTSSVAASWTRLLGATGYRVYRSTASNAEVLLATISSGTTTTYSDTGAVTPSGASPPTTGTAAGVVVTISGVEVPA